MRLTWILAAIVVLAGCVQGPQDGTGGAPGVGPEDPIPPDTGNVWLLDGIRPVQDSSVSGGAEPSILTDKDGRYVWIGDTTGAYWSDDNGTTWNKSPNFLLPSVFVDGWALAQDDDGALYAAALIGPAIDVARSTDGGRSWNQVTRGAALSGTTDRPWLAARGSGEVTLIYFDAPLVATGFFEHCARSLDGGRTWIERDPIAGSPQAGGLVYDPDGRFYYTDDQGTLYRFEDGCLGAITTWGMFGSLGANNMIQTAADATGVYTVAATSGNEGLQVSGLGPDDVVPHRVSFAPEPIKSFAFPTISVHDGNIAVAWYGSETPGDPSRPSYDGAFNVYVATIEDFWGDPQISVMRLTDEPNHVGDICMGGISCTNDASADRDLLDYFMIDHDKWGGLHVAYVHDGSGSDAQVRYAHIPPSVEEGAPVVGATSSPDAPVPAFSMRQDRYSIKVDASASMDPQGGDLDYAWSWGDGSGATGVKAEHTYDGPGSFTVTLTVTDVDGVASSLDRQVLIDGSKRNRDPVADFTFTPGNPVAPGDTVRFHDGSSDPDGSIVSWHWDFGDGATAGTRNATHVFQEPGSHEVTLTVTDDWGDTDTHVSTVLVDDGTGGMAPDTGGPMDGGNGGPVGGSDTQDSPGLAVVLVLAAFVLVALRRR